MSQALKPTTDLANRIALVYPSLSGAHRRAADFVLQNPLDTATMTIEGLADRSRTSTATVTRFVRALGYSGYGEFRGALSAALKVAMAPVDSLADARATESTAVSTLITALKDQAANLQETITAIDENVCTRAIEALLKAHRIFIVGSGASHHVAGYLEEGLALYLDANVIFASSGGGPEHALRHIMSVGPDDLVLAISVPRYSRGTVDLANLAKKRNAMVLALTDSPSSPLVPIADMTLFAPARNRLLPNSPLRDLRPCRRHHHGRRARKTRCGRGPEGAQRKSPLDVLSVMTKTGSAFPHDALGDERTHRMSGMQS